MFPFILPQTIRPYSYNNSYEYDSNSKQTKKQYYKLLNFKPMFIKLNVSSYGSPFLPQLINVSMIKEIRGGFTELNGLSPDKWCVATFIDGDDQWVEGSMDEIQSQIWKEQDINKK